MPGAPQYKKSSLSFAELVEDGVRAYQRARTLKNLGDAEAEIAEKIGIGTRTLQSWRSKVIPAQYELVVAFAKVCVEANPDKLGVEWVGQLVQTAQMAGYRDQAIKEIFGDKKTGRELMDRYPGSSGEMIEPTTLKQCFIPPLPADCIERKAQHQLEAMLTARDDAGKPAWRGVILYGLMGMGKTTLAALAVQAEGVKQAFEAVVWIDVANGRAEQWLEQVCGAMRLSRQAGQSWGDCWQAWSGDAQRRLLLVVDQVSGEGLGPVLARLGEHTVVVVIAEDAGSARGELLNWWRGNEIHELKVGGLTPEEARELVERRLGQPLAPAQWDRLQKMGVQMEWLPEAMPLLAVAEDAAALWPGLLESLQAGDLPFERVRTKLESWKRERLEEHKRQWLQELAGKLKYGGVFGEAFAVWAWGTTVEAARERLQGLRRAGVIEPVRGQMAGLELVNTGWRILPLVRWMFSVPRGEWRGIQRAWQAWRSGKWHESSLGEMPWQFGVWMTIWLVLFGSVKLVVELALGLIEGIVGERGWRSALNQWTIAFTAEGHLKRRCVELGATPSEEFGLMYDTRIMEAALLQLPVYGVLIGWYGFVQLRVARPWVDVCTILADVWVVYWVVRGMRQLAWRIWIAHLYGVETWDVRLALAAARRLGMKEPERNE